jgi:hypothetical protein
MNQASDGTGNQRQRPGAIKELRIGTWNVFTLNNGGTFSQPEGSPKKGRYKLRWLDIVSKDVKLLKVEAWWKKALDRNI